jgi:hypothetical protein
MGVRDSRSGALLVGLTDVRLGTSSHVTPIAWPVTILMLIQYTGMDTDQPAII